MGGPPCVPTVRRTCATALLAARFPWSRPMPYGPTLNGPSRAKDDMSAQHEHLAPTADVVICTYTDARWDLLERAVASLQAQSVAPARILLCVDHNDELLERCRVRWGPGSDQPGPSIDVFPNRFAGRLGSARNTAVERVTAEVVAFLDDDAEADPTWLETLLSVYVEDGAVAVGGAPLPNHQIARPGWFPPECRWALRLPLGGPAGGAGAGAAPDRCQHVGADRRAARGGRLPLRQ